MGVHGLSTITPDRCRTARGEARGRLPQLADELPIGVGQAHDATRRRDRQGVGGRGVRHPTLFHDTADDAEACGEGC